MRLRRAGELRPIDELERSLDRLRLDGDASRQLLDGVLASEDVIGAFADAQAFACALATLPRRRPAAVARPVPRLAFATVVLACTMSVGTAFAQDLPAIAELAVARVVALIEGPVALEAAAEAPVAGAPWRETPASNVRAPEPASPSTPAATEIEPEPELPAPSAALEPTPAAEPAEAHVGPPPTQPERAVVEPGPADEPVVPVPDRAGPPQLPDGGDFEELEPVVEPAPVVDSSPALPEASAAPELPSLPEPTADPPVVAEEPDPAEDEEEPPADEPVDEEPVEDEEEPPAEEPVEEEPVDDEEPVEEEEPPAEDEPVDEEPVDDDEEGKGKKDKKEKEDHADEHAHEHADEHAAIHDEDQP